MRFASIKTFIRELQFRAGVWSPTESSEIDKSVSEFIATNKLYWPERIGGKQGILIEGHLSQYGPTYLFRTALAARAIQEKTNLDIEVVFPGYSYQWVLAEKIYGSFGINKRVYLGSFSFITKLFLFSLSRILAVWHISRLSSPEDILKITFSSIKVGDLIYDDVIRERETRSKTIESINRDVKRCIVRSLFYYLQYKLLFKKRSYSYYISTHSAYSEYGLLCRVALMSGVKVIETTDIQMSFYDKISNNQLPTYHDGIRNSISTSLNGDHAKLDRLHVAASESLHLRLDSKINQIDAQKAYCGRVYTKAEFRQELGIKQEQKIVFVLAHVFADSPHLSSAMLHADYYQWLASTLDVCARSTDVSWIIKPHPSSFLYGEDGLVETMVANLEASNVFICPADLNTKSLSLCADALVTVHGTAGLEFSCLGIPVVLAGKPFYYGFGFTIEPSSREDYERQLLEIADIAPLTENQVKKALEVYAIWDEQFDWHNPIITSEVQANVWGSGVPRDLAKAYHLLAENLRVTDPRELKLWKFVQDVVK